MASISARIAILRKWVAAERVAHAFIALLLASVIAFSTLLRPLDVTIWSLQAKLFDKSASGEITFLYTDYTMQGGQAVIDNGELANALEKLAQTDVEQIYLDLPLHKSGSDADDKRLRSVLRAGKDRFTISETFVPEASDQFFQITSDDYFSDGLRSVVNNLHFDFLGFVWVVEEERLRNKSGQITLARSLADEETLGEFIFLDYNISPNSIAKANLGEFVNLGEKFPTDLTSKVVVGISGSDIPGIKIPNGERLLVSSPIIHIIAAETVLAGGGTSLGSYTLLLIFGGTLLLSLIFIHHAKSRRLIYGVWILMYLAGLTAISYLGIGAILSAPICLGFIYAALRLTVRYKQRHLLVEPRSGLPNFVALQRDLSEVEHIDEKALVVAKIARLEAVFAMLSTRDQSEYLRQVAARLTLGSNNTQVYFDGAKHLAFCVSAAAYPQLRSHLEGLRAVSSQSIEVSGQPIDVSLTLGADNSENSSIARKISSAIAAAERAREAYDPVFISGNLHRQNEAWDYSLQARLEQALSNDDISIKLQPQIRFSDNAIIGAEALVRWSDGERGEIPAAEFIAQSESVGRLDDLTQRVMAKSFQAAVLCERNGLRPTISINISSIQLVDRRITDMLRNEFEQYKVDPANIKIEITETARIDDPVMARIVCDEIRTMGVTLSIDDFGVGSANLEVLSQLPFDELKIDRVFVQKINSSAKAHAIVANMIQLSKDMNLISVAEGVEDKSTFDVLCKLGCDRGQGYFIAKPMPISDFLKLIREDAGGNAGRREYG